MLFIFRCSPKLEIGSEEENAKTCPVAELGFDVEMSTTFGAQVYSLIGPYARVALVTPFRVTVCIFLILTQSHLYTYIFKLTLVTGAHIKRVTVWLGVTMNRDL